MARVAIAFLAGVVGISFAAIFVRLALPAPPVTTGFYRMLFASAALLAWPGLRGRALGLEPRAALLALAAGGCFGADLALWHTSIVKTSVAMATLLVNTTPIPIGLWALVVLRQRLAPSFVVGAGLAIAGCVLLLGISRDDLERAQGALLALGASLFYAGYLLLIKAARGRGDAGPTLLLANLGSTAVLGLAAVAGGDALHGFPARSWAAIAGAALVSQLGGVTAIVWALGYLPATVASVALLAQTVGTALLGGWLLGEALTASELAGGALVLAGIALASRSAALQPLSPGTAAASTTGRTPGGPSRPSS